MSAESEDSGGIGAGPVGDLGGSGDESGLGGGVAAVLVAVAMGGVPMTMVTAVARSRCLRGKRPEPWLRCAWLRSRIERC